MKIYFVRHGQIPSNDLKQYPHTYESLTDTGKKQAADLRQKIANKSFDVIICSPLARTRQTAEIVNINNIRIIFDDRIKERDYGDLAGKPLEYINRGEWWDYNSSKQFETSENIKPFFNRIFDFLDDLKQKDYDDVLVVAHAGVAKAFSGYFEGMGDGKFIDRKFNNCELKEYEL